MPWLSQGLAGNGGFVSIVPLAIVFALFIVYVCAMGLRLFHEANCRHLQSEWQCPFQLPPVWGGNGPVYNEHT